MGMIRLSPDFKEFLKLLNENNVRYLLVGGYAVAFHGYPRTTGDMDIWIAFDPTNASKVTKALREFGFSETALREELFTNPKNVIRMGIPPYRIEVLTTVDGIEFESSFTNRIIENVDGVEISIISKQDLIANKLSAGRNKDLDDVENLK